MSFESNKLTVISVPLPQRKIQKESALEKSLNYLSSLIQYKNEVLFTKDESLTKEKKSTLLKEINLVINNENQKLQYLMKQHSGNIIPDEINKLL